MMSLRHNQFTHWNLNNSVMIHDGFEWIFTHFVCLSIHLCLWIYFTATLDSLPPVRRQVIAWNNEDPVNQSPPGQDGRHFGRRHFQTHFLQWNIKISIQISLKFVPGDLIDNTSALVQVMAWRRAGDKPLPKAMMTQFTDAYMRHLRGDELTDVYMHHQPHAS